MQPATGAWNGFVGPFADRADAGRVLAMRLSPLQQRDPIVMGLPRGGVVVAAEVARILRAPLEIVVVRKVGAPGNPELAMGAAGEGGVLVRNDELIDALGVDRAAFDAAAASATAEVDERSRRLRGGRPPTDVAGRIVVLIDDGIATGATAEAAIRVLKARGAAEVVLAVPVAPPEVVARLGRTADQVVVVDAPRWLGAVGAWYADFSEVTDDQVLGLLHAAPDPPDPRDVSVRVDGELLPGTLTVPESPAGLVVFAHGSGSSRLSPRNVFVAQRMATHGLATLLFDLLTSEEEVDRSNVFDIDLLASRLQGAVEQIVAAPGSRASPSGSSEPAPGRPPRSWPPASCREMSQPSSHAGDARIWRGRGWSRWFHRPSSSSAVPIGK